MILVMVMVMGMLKVMIEDNDGDERNGCCIIRWGNILSLDTKTARRRATDSGLGYETGLRELHIRPADPIRTEEAQGVPQKCLENRHGCCKRVH